MFDTTKVLRPFSNYFFIGNLLQDNLVYKSNLVSKSTANSTKKKKKTFTLSNKNLNRKKQLNEEKRNKYKPSQ